MGLKDIHDRVHSPTVHSGKFDPLQAASQATDDYDEDEDISSARRSRVVRIAVATILLVVIGGAGMYGFIVWQKHNQDLRQAAANAQVRVTQPRVPATAIAARTKHYVSPGFALEFDYPQDWTVLETAGSGQLTVTSPALGLKPMAGDSFTGQVVLTFRNKQQALPEFDKGNAVAVRESQKITYTKPSSAQRGSTYLSFLNYAGSTDNGQLDGVFITGDVGYTVGQAIPRADFVPIDPVVSITFLKCATIACTGNGTQVGITPTMWDNAQFGTPLTSMLQSLTVN